MEKVCLFEDAALSPATYCDVEVDESIISGVVIRDGKVYEKVGEFLDGRIIYEKNTVAPAHVPANIEKLKTGIAKLEKQLAVLEEIASILPAPVVEPAPELGKEKGSNADGTCNCEDGLHKPVLKGE